MNNNVSSSRVLKYTPKEHHFKLLVETSSSLFQGVVKKRGTNYTPSFSDINNRYVVSSFNLENEIQGNSVFKTELVVISLQEGQVLHRIKEENSAVNMKTNVISMALHPTFENILVTSDAEGQIIFWDCTLGVATRIFVEHAGHIGNFLETNAASDCNFSKNGDLLIVGTQYGSFSLYGYGGAGTYDHTDPEQFTNTDYESISVHPDTFQIINHLGQEIGKGDEKWEPCNFNLTKRPVLTNAVDYKTAREWIDEKAYANRYRITELKKADEAFLKELREILLIERTTGQKYRLKKKISALRGEGFEMPKQAVEIQDLSQGLIINQTLEQATGRASTTQYVNRHPEEDSEDSSRFIRRLRRRRVASESSVSEDDLEEAEGDNDEFLGDPSDEDEDIPRRRRAIPGGRPSRPTTYTENRLRRGIRTRTGPALRSRNSNPQNRDTVEDSDDDSHNFYQGFRRANRARKEGTETPTLVEEMFCKRCGQIGAREKCTGAGRDGSGKCDKVYHQHCSDISGTDIKDKFICFDCLLDYYDQHPTTFDYPKSDLDDEWLDIEVQDKDLIAPQIGDRYYFIFQAYESFVSEYFNLLNFERGSEFWPWRKFPCLIQKDVKCEVMEITYEFPKLRGKKIYSEFKKFLTILMKIKLKIIDTELDLEDQASLNEEEQGCFEIKYFPVSNHPIFLVWHQLYEKKAAEYSLVQTYSELRYDDKFYNIKEVSSEIKTRNIQLKIVSQEVFFIVSNADLC